MSYDYALSAGCKHYDVLAFGAIAYIMREASALSVLLRWAIPGPQGAERAASTALTHYVYKKPRGEPKA